MDGGNQVSRLVPNLEEQGGTEAANSNSTELQALQLPQESARLRKRTNHNYGNSSEILKINPNIT